MLLLSPGREVPAFRAAQWFSGEAPFPGPDDAGLLTLLDPWNSGNAAPLAFYRLNDRAAEAELRSTERARDLDKQAASAATAAEREAIEIAAEAIRRRAEAAVESGERLRAEAVARGWRPPPLIMLLVPRGEGSER